MSEKKPTQGVGVSRVATDDTFRAIYRSVRREWRKYADINPKIKKWGYEVLNGPPHVRPRLLCVSLNPGYTQAILDAGYNLTPRTYPSTLTFLSRKTKFARRVLDLLERAGVNSEDCVFTYSLPFRSNSYRAWRQGVEPPHRYALDKFSKGILSMIVEAVEPQAILTIGAKPFRANSQVSGKSVYGAWGQKRITLLRSGARDGIPVYGIPHISGARLSEGHFKELGNRLKKALRSTRGR